MYVCVCVCVCLVFLCDYTYVCMYVCMYVCPLDQIYVICCLIKLDVFWHLLILFRSVPQSIVIHTDNYIQRNGTEPKYPELLAGLHGTGKGIL